MKNTRVVLIWFVALTGCAAVLADGLISPATNPASTGLSAARLSHIKTLASSYVDQGRIPGVVYAVARHGQLASLDSVGAMQTDSIFRIYSMTKPITTVAVLMLYEEGRFLLSDPVSRYLPEFEHMQIYTGEDQNGNAETVPAEKQVTIEDLLTHTAGLTYGDKPEGGVWALYADAKLWSSASLDEFSNRVAELPLVFEPGSAWHYSVSFDVLGRLVEVVADQPFDQFLKTRIFDPLQMNDTSFSLPDSKLGRFIPVYYRDGEGMRLSEAVEDSGLRQAGAVPFGGGGLLSTATDYLRFCQMLVNGGVLADARILGRKTVELMLLDHLGHGDSRLKINDPWVGRTENRSGEMQLGLGFGYGGYVITDVAENDVPGSTGTYAWGGAASTYFFIDPKEELIGVFLTQLMPSDSYPLRAQFRGLVYQAIVD